MWHNYSYSVLVLFIPICFCASASDDASRQLLPCTTCHLPHLFLREIILFTSRNWKEPPTFCRDLVDDLARKHGRTCKKQNSGKNWQQRYYQQRQANIHIEWRIDVAHVFLKLLFAALDVYFYPVWQRSVMPENACRHMPRRGFALLLPLL